MLYLFVVSYPLLLGGHTLGAQQAKLDADIRISPSQGTPSIQYVHY
jgi:hypothetical protein